MSFMFPTNQFVTLNRAGIWSFLRKIWRGMWVPAFVWAVVFPVQSYAQVTTAIIPDATLPTNSSVTQIAETFHITDGTSVGSNLFHSFDTFHVGAGDTANFVNPGGIDNILSRVTGGVASNIFGTLQSESSANLFFLNPSGVVFGPTAELNVNGSFHVSTANSLRLGEGPDAGMFNAKNPAQDILVVDPPSAFGFLDDNPAGITIDQSMLQVPQGKTLSMVGGDIEIVGGPNQMLSAPGGQVNLASLKSEGAVSLDLQSVVVTGPESFGTISLSDQAVIDTSGEGGGTVVIRGGSLFIDHSFIRADTNGEINGGLIDIALNKELSVENGGTIRAKSFGNGNAGDINIATRLVSLTAGSQIDSSTSGPGQAGALTVEASQEVVIAGTSPFGANSGLFSNSFGSGEAAPLSVTTPQLTVEGGRILTNANGTGNAAPLTLAVDILSLLNGAQVDSSTSGPGQAGALTVEASQEVVIAGADSAGTVSGLFSNTFGEGNAGHLFVSTPDLQMNNGRIRSTTDNKGDAAPIDLRVGRLQLTGGAQIDSSTFGSGKGANLNVIADESISIRGVNSSGLRSGLFSNAKGAGASGDFLSVSAPILIIEGGRIVTNTLGNGKAGDINVEVDTLELREGAQIFSGTGSIEKGKLIGGGSGEGGSITIEARDSILITGTDLEVQSDGFKGSSGLFSSAQIGAGAGGDINVTTNLLEISGEGEITARTQEDSTGNAGKILIMVDHAILKNGGSVNSSTFGPGQGGLVSVVAKEFTTFLGEGSGIFTQASGDGSGGNIQVAAGSEVSLNNGASFAANSMGRADAGNIVIQSGDIIQLDNSSITTGAVNASGGNIKLQAEELIRLNNSTISSSVQGDATTVGGNISLDPEFIILQNSQILAKAVEGQGGNISLIASQAVLVDSFSVLDASSTLGVSGSVNIQAPTKFLSGAIVPLENPPVNVATLYGARCAAGAGGHFSTFVDSKTDSLSPAPGTFLASPLLLPSAQAVADTSAGPPPSPVVLTASIAPLVLGHAGEPMTACP